MIKIESYEELEPYIDMNYWCESCGSKSGESHPVTGMCWLCGADDWEPYNYRDVV